MISPLKQLRPLVSRFSRSHPDGDQAFSPPMAALASNLHYEIVPTKSIEQAMADLPPGSDVSVTCSPTKGIPDPGGSPS